MRAASRSERTTAGLLAALADLAGRLARCADRGTRSEIMAELWRLLSAERDRDAIAELAGASGYGELRAVLAGQWAQHVFTAEHQESTDLLARFPERRGREPGPSVLAMEDYPGVLTELALLGGCSFGQVVVVGAGPYPETAMALCDHGVVARSVVAVDRHRSAVRLGGRILRCYAHTWPTLTTTVRRARGELFDYGEADLVFLANGLTGKQAVLDRIARTGPAQVRVLARTPALLARLLYENLPVPPDGAWRVAGTAEPTPLSRTVLLERAC